jgi:UDP-glucose 4-epimerase
MRILVTGGAGFIASHVVDAYVAKGHDVVVVDNLSTGVKENLNPRATFVEVDLQSPKLEEVFRSYPFDVVNHHAAQIDVRKSVEDPSFDATTNIVGGIRLYELARKQGVKKIIFASTGGAIYGEQDYFPADEEHPARPISPYGIAKLSNEKYLYYYKEVYGIEYVVLRYANVYGPRQNPHGEAGVVAIFCNKFVAGGQPVINGDGLQSRDYTFVADVVNANVLALQYRDSAIFNVGTGIEKDVNAVFRALRESLSPNSPEQHGPARLGEQRRSVISYKRVERELGWKPTVSIDEGLRITANWFKAKAKQ